MRILRNIIITVVIALALSSCSTTVHNRKSGYATGSSLTSGQQRELVKEAERWLGTPYVYGGHSKSGTDCSGMVMEVYQKVTGVKLPRSSREMSEYCQRIDYSKINVGDLVFFTTSKNSNAVSHVGLYIGSGQMIHASSSKGVIRSDLNGSYYKRTYHSSGRVPMGSSTKRSAGTVASSSSGSKSGARGAKSSSRSTSGKKSTKQSSKSKSSSKKDKNADKEYDSIYSPFFD